MADNGGQERVAGMGALARIDLPERLTEKQRRFVDAIISGEPPEAAIRQAGYADTVHYSVILGGEAVQKALRADCEAQLVGPIRVKALKAIEAMLGTDTPAATRFQAAKFVLERGKDSQRDGDKPLSEMTEDELRGVIERSQAAMNEAQSTKIINITPQSGAEPDQANPPSGG